MLTPQAKISVKRYRKTVHEQALAHWFGLRRVAMRNLFELPERGVVAVDEHDKPIAVAFLRAVEGNFAMLDGLTTDPLASSIDRHNAIEAVVDTLIHMAKKYGYSKLVAYSVDDGTLKRAKTHGFEAVPHSVITLDLQRET